jgi:hypothetical protein
MAHHLSGRHAPGYVGLAARLRRETPLTIRELAERLHLGSWKHATTRLQDLKRIKERHGATASS